MKALSWLVAAAAVAIAAPSLALEVGDKAPDFEMSKTWNIEGKTKLSDFQGEYIKLVFWATW